MKIEYKTVEINIIKYLNWKKNIIKEGRVGGFPLTELLSQWHVPRCEENICCSNTVIPINCLGILIFLLSKHCGKLPKCMFYPLVAHINY